MAAPSKPGRKKKPVKRQITTMHAFFNKKDDPVDVHKLVRKTINEILIEVVDKSERKSKRHSASGVSCKTIESWKVQYPWLEFFKSGEESRMRCKTCREKGVNSIWAEIGSSNVQKNGIERHARSLEHRKAEECLTACKSGKVECEVFEQVTGTVCIDDEKLFRTVYYAAKEELPSSKINSLLELQNLNGASIKYKNLSWDTIKEIQSCISSIIQQEVIEEVLQSDFYALMIDESTDIAVQKHLSVCIRYVINGEPVTKFLANIAIDDGKAHTIVSELTKCISEVGLDLSKLVSLATDGASTMTGKKTGVGVQMKSKHSPFVVQTHCIAHRLNLAVTDSIKKDSCLENFREKFASLFYFMSGSSNRTTTLSKIQILLNEPELTIKEPHSIRWLGLLKAVEAVYWSYGSVLATLSKYAEEKQPAAHGLYKYFSEYKTVLLVGFMLDVHESIAVLSQELQKQSIVFSEVQPMMEATIGKLEFLKTKDGKRLKDIKECIIMKTDDSGSTVASLSGEKLKKFSETACSEFDSIRQRYVSKLIKNIQSRFKKEDSDIFKDLSLLLEPLTVNAASESDCKESLESLGSFYGQEKTVKMVHGCATEGVTEEEKEVKNLLDEEKLYQEWPMLKGMIQGSYSKLTTPELCKRITSLHSEALPEFSKLCKIALCISVTSVECERSFSVQNRIKCKYRSSLKAEGLDNLITIQMCKVDVRSFVPTRAVRLWHSKKKRRVARLCQEYKPAKKKAKLSSEKAACSSSC